MTTNVIFSQRLSFNQKQAQNYICKHYNTVKTNHFNMIKKVQQDLRAFFFTQDKYISHDKHLPFLKDPGDDIIIVMLYQHCHQQ